MTACEWRLHLNLTGSSAIHRSNYQLPVVWSGTIVWFTSARHRFLWPHSQTGRRPRGKYGRPAGVDNGHLNYNKTDTLLCSLNDNLLYTDTVYVIDPRKHDCITAGRNLRPNIAHFDRKRKKRKWKKSFSAVNKTAENGIKRRFRYRKRISVALYTHTNQRYQKGHRFTDHINWIIADKKQN